MFGSNALKIYETRIFVSQTAWTGAGEEYFQVLSGARMLVTFKVLAADPGTTIAVGIDNTHNTDDGFDTLDTLTLNSSGLIKRIYSDFHNLFRLRYSVVGGTATLRVAVSLHDNAATTKIENATVDVNLNHTLDAEGRFDSVRVGDGQDLLAINPDGSVNVNPTDPVDEVTVYPYDEVDTVISGVTTTVMSYTVPAGKLGYLYHVEGSGENVAKYQVLVNSLPVATKRSYFGSGLNVSFDFNPADKKPIKLQAGDIIEVTVKHDRPNVGNFEARAVVVIKG